MNPKQECEQLMNDLVPFAKRMLLENSEFYPFGGFIKVDGSIVHAGGNIEGTEHPASADVITVLNQNMKAMADAGTCRATAIVFDVRIKAPGASEATDAIQVNLDHKDNYSVQVFFPYSASTDGGYQYGAVFAQRGDGVVFTH